MSDSQDFLRYDKMVERALRGVVRQAVREVMAEGKLIDDHHFYITFLTDYAGVKIPDYLRERYPGEMTIVLQYQFDDLDIDEEKLTVTLSFNNVPEKLIVPLAAITIFADPSVNFALQFQPITEASEETEAILNALDEAEEDNGGDDDGSGGGKGKGKGSNAPSGEVISLDKFRKK